MNVMMLLEMAAQGFGERVAFSNGEASMTYGQLFGAAQQAARQLKSRDCEYVAMLGVSSLALPIGLFASACAGLPFVPLNYRLAAKEIEALLQRIQPAWLITDRERVESRPVGSGIEAIEFQQFIDLARAGHEGSRQQAWSMDQEDVGVLLFTSGTTGAPKAAVLRQKHLVSYIFASVEFGCAAESDAALVAVPPYHIAGIAAVLSSVFAGRRVVQLPNFSAGEWIKLARRERVTNAFLVPTMLAQIVNELEGEASADMPHLRALSYGGGKMPQSLIERAMALFPETDFTNAYGLTETSSTIALLGPNDHRDAAASQNPQLRRRLTSVGRPLPSVEVEIRDEAGAVLAPGQRGEIYVRGEQVSGEYVGRGSSLDADGWFPTRDAGSLDEEGYLFLEGRADDVIVRGGENLSPGEIEDVLLAHQAVADAAVFGVPDEQWGEAVAAIVVIKPGEAVSTQELQAWVGDQLRSSRVPQSIHFTEELPYNEMGKLLRRVLKNRYQGH